MALANELSNQLLREAYIRMTSGFRWDDDFETVMLDRVRIRLVRLAAQHPSASDRPAVQTPRAPAYRPQPFSTCRPTRIDRERAASGEWDDD